MRIALLSDIHGNFNALESVLKDIEQQQIDLLVSLGDVCTIGPQPEMVLNRLREMDCFCVMGNHDKALLEPEKMEMYKIAPPLISSLHWCADRLKNEDLDFLHSFEPIVEIQLPLNATLLCFHGSPRSFADNILPTTSTEELDNYFAGYHSELIASGHSHLQMLRNYGGSVLINPGSVGQPFLKSPSGGMEPELLPWCEYAIVDCEKRETSFSFRRIPFDVSRYSSLIKNSDIPIKDWLLRQYKD